MNKRIYLGVGLLLIIGLGWYFSSGTGLKGSFYDPSSRKSVRQAATPMPNKAREIKNTPAPTSAAPYVGLYYFADKDTTIGEIYNDTEASIIAYYDKEFMLYPVTGPYAVKQAQARQKIPKNRGVILVRYNNYDNIFFSDVFLPATAKPTSTTAAAPLSDYESGWVLVASKETKLSDYIAPFKDRVASVWAMKSNDAFEKVDINNFSFGKYSMAWIKLVAKGDKINTGGAAGDMAPNIKIDPESFIPKQAKP